MEEILRIKVRSVTPVSFGWYDTYSDNFPRITSIRGIVRWWTRALIGGWAYEKGYNQIDAVNKIIEKIFGLSDKASRLKFIVNKANISVNNGKQIKHYRFNSLIFIEIHNLKNAVSKALNSRPNQKTFPKIYKGLGKVLESLNKMEKVFPPRIAKKIIERNIKEKLEKAKRGKLYREILEELDNALNDMLNILYQEMLKEFTFELSLFSSSISQNKFDELGLIGTVLAFQLGCFGKAARRGLGCFKIEKIEYDKYNLFSNYINSDIKQKINYLIKEAYDVLDNLDINKLGISRHDYSNEIPNFPSIIINNKNYRYYSLFIKNVENINQAYNEIKKLFVRTERGLANSLRYRPVPSAWYLGLPRSQRGKGYIDGELRRASPILVKVDEYNGRPIILISHFVSKDWPLSFRWKGRRLFYIKVDKRTVLSLARDVNYYLARSGYQKIL